MNRNIDVFKLTGRYTWRMVANIHFTEFTAIKRRIRSESYSSKHLSCVKCLTCAHLFVGYNLNWLAHWTFPKSRLYTWQRKNMKPHDFIDHRNLFGVSGKLRLHIAIFCSIPAIWRCIMYSVIRWLDSLHTTLQCLHINCELIELRRYWCGFVSLHNLL